MDPPKRCANCMRTPFETPCDRKIYLTTSKLPVNTINAIDAIFEIFPYLLEQIESNFHPKTFLCRSCAGKLSTLHKSFQRFKATWDHSGILYKSLYSLLEPSEPTPQTPSSLPRAKDGETQTFVTLSQSFPTPKPVPLQKTIKLAFKNKKKQTIIANVLKQKVKEEMLSLSRSTVFSENADGETLAPKSSHCHKECINKAPVTLAILQGIYGKNKDLQFHPSMMCIIGIAMQHFNHKKKGFQRWMAGILLRNRNMKKTLNFLSSLGITISYSTASKMMKMINQSDISKAVLEREASDNQLCTTENVTTPPPTSTDSTTNHDQQNDTDDDDAASSDGDLQPDVTMTDETQETSLPVSQSSSLLEPDLAVENEEQPNFSISNNIKKEITCHVGLQDNYAVLSEHMYCKQGFNRGKRETGISQSSNIKQKIDDSRGNLAKQFSLNHINVKSESADITADIETNSDEEMQESN